MPGIASIVEQDGAKKVAVMTNGRTDLMSLDEAKGLEDALRVARETVDNDAGAKRLTAEQEERAKKGSEEREKEIKEANSKADADSAKRFKEREESERAGLSAAQRRDIEERTAKAHGGKAEKPGHDEEDAPHKRAHR